MINIAKVLNYTDLLTLKLKGLFFICKNDIDNYYQLIYYNCMPDIQL